MGPMYCLSLRAFSYFACSSMNFRIHIGAFDKRGCEWTERAAAVERSKACGTLSHGPETPTWSLSDLKLLLAASHTYLKLDGVTGSCQNASHVTLLSCRTCRRTWKVAHSSRNRSAPGLP